jgi:hypothetical protein
MISLRNRLFATIALLSAFAAFDSKGDIFTSCGIDLGAAGRTKSWAAFTIGGTVHVDDLDGTSYIIGDVGASGAGTIDMSGTTTIYGDVYYHTGGFLHQSGHSLVTGAIHSDAASDALLNQGAIDAQNASDAAFALATTPGTPTSINTNHNTTINLTGACTVLRLSTFQLKGGAILTLNGTASQAIVINVANAGNKNFFMDGGSRVILQGGLTWDSVLWNYRGTGNSKADFHSGSRLIGILLATKAKIEIEKGSSIFGEAIGNWIDLTGGASIQNPRFTPSQNP